MSVYARRRRKIREWLELNGCDAIVISSAANVRYLFGFCGEGLAVVGDECVVCTDRRYELAADAIPGRVGVEVHPDGHLAGAVAALRAARVKRVAFEAEAITYATYETLVARLEGVATVASRKVVEGPRAIKDKTELAAIAQACVLMDRALGEVAPLIVPGCTEREIALQLERSVLLAGAEKLAFPPIVAFGPSAAHPHAVPSLRRLELGQMVKIDCGAMVDGYCSDITRTILVGEPDERYRQVYTVVFRAQAAAVAAARAGMRASDLDTLARDIIRDAGFGDQYSHGLGHGVGLEVHELPKVGARSDEVLAPGMVITIEPGVYCEGWGGVRIEDTVALTRTGCAVLTHFPKQEPCW